MLWGGSRVPCMIYGGMFPGLDLPYKADPAQHLLTAGRDIDDLSVFR